MTRHHRFAWVILLATILLPVSQVCAQGKADDYPSRPVRMIVPFAPGGASDTVGRIIQPAMADLLKQQVVVDNRGGAAGNIGVEVAVRASPDGYNFLLGNVGTMAINPVYYTKFKYRPLKDLVPITQVVDVPGCLVVHPSLPARNAKDIVAHLKANPGKLNYGAPAPSSANALEMIMFLSATGTNAVQVNYKGGAGPAMIGLLGNEVQMMFVTFSSAVNFAKQGRVRMLGVISPERNPAYPEIPTMREQGFNMAVGSWQGLFVPKGTPQAVVGKLYKVGVAMMKDPGVVKRLGDNGITIVTSKSPSDFVAFVKAETERFGKVIKDNNIKTE
jgi:tripartite-type tricarboxylate transporter receptor subunit TctC